MEFIYFKEKSSIAVGCTWRINLSKAAYSNSIHKQTVLLVTLLNNLMARAE